MTRNTKIENIARGLCIQDGKVLIARVREDNYYFLPGGHVEDEEGMFKTLEREICEETGLTASAKELLLVFEHGWQGKQGNVHEINFIISCNISAAQEMQSQEPHLDFSWVSIDELAELHFLPSELLPIVTAIARGQEYPKFFSTIA